MLHLGQNLTHRKEWRILEDFAGGKYYSIPPCSLSESLTVAAALGRPDLLTAPVAQPWRDRLPEAVAQRLDDVQREIVRRWRASAALQVICDVLTATDSPQFENFDAADTHEDLRNWILANKLAELSTDDIEHLERIVEHFLQALAAVRHSRSAGSEDP